MEINNNQGGYIYYCLENKSINLFIYKKLTRENLARALPLEPFHKFYENEYLSAIFQDGTDYVGCTNFDDIKKVINEFNMFNLIDLSFENLKKNITNQNGILTKEIYDQYKEFALDQLNNE